MRGGHKCRRKRLHRHDSDRQPGLQPDAGFCALSKHLAFKPEFSKMAAKPPVIRASGGRCDDTRCAPPLARGAIHYPCGEAAEP